MPFYPINDGSDVFYMQYAQSWGQAWSKKMWNSFYNWYLENLEWDKEVSFLPDNVLNWSDKSWLKYFIKYCVVSNKYYVYPYQSLSTNFSEIGEHNKNSNLSMQRDLSYASDNKYKFSVFDDSIAKYDCFFENIYLKSLYDYDNTTIDLYSKKKINKKYLLSTTKLTYQIIKKYGLYLKPIELNILNQIPGNDIFLYDTSKKSINSNAKGNYKLLNYYWYNFDVLESLKYLFGKIKNYIIDRLSRGKK